MTFEEYVTRPYRCEHCGCLLIEGHECILRPDADLDIRQAEREEEAKIDMKIRNMEMEIAGLESEIKSLHRDLDELETQKRKLVQRPSAARGHVQEQGRLHV